MTGLNFATRTGEGAADVLSFGNLDAAAKRLYAEQKQKEFQGQKEYELAQQELSKEFSKVRSADVKDLMTEYDAVKRARQKLLFDPKVKNDPMAYAEAQKEARLLESQLRTAMQESAELKELDKQVSQRLSTNRDDFDDDKVPQFFNSLNMPTKERRALGLVGAEPFRFKGIDMKGFGAAAQKAMGSAVNVPYGQRKVVDGGFNYEQPMIARTNDPVQYASNLYREVSSTKNFAQGARAMYSQMTPQQMNSIVAGFQQIPDAEFEAKWGRKKEDLVKQFNNADDKVGQYVLLDAMKYATDFLPKEVAPKKEANVEFKRDQDYQDWLKKNKITDSQATKRAYISRAANGTTSEPVFYYDSYGEIQEKLKGKKGGLALNELTGTTQENVLNIAKKSLGSNDIDNSQLTIYTDPNTGELGLYKVNETVYKGKPTAFVGDKIAKLTDLDLNYSNAPSVREKREIAQKQNTGKKPQPSSKPKKDPLNLF